MRLSLFAKNRHYDFIEPESDDTDALQLRVLKFPIEEDSYEYIVTNLPKYAFPLQTIKELYNLSIPAFISPLSPCIRKPPFRT